MEDKFKFGIPLNKIRIMKYLHLKYQIYFAGIIKIFTLSHSQSKKITLKV